MQVKAEKLSKGIYLIVIREIDDPFLYSLTLQTSSGGKTFITTTKRWAIMVVHLTYGAVLLPLWKFCQFSC